MSIQCIITKSELLKYWQGHRSVTRKTIALFPEKELFEFKIGGMRSFAEMAKELLTIAVPGLTGILKDKMEEVDHAIGLNSKQEILEQWDADTIQIEALFNQITDERFREEFAVYGDYKLSVIQNIIYFIDNEIHHRGQGYVYLRALGIEPPFFWEGY